VQMKSVAGSTTVPMRSAAQKSAAGSRSQVAGSHGGTRSQVSGSQYQEEEDEEEDEVQLPLPPLTAHTTTRKLAGVGPANLSNLHAPGLLHRLAMHGRTEQVDALLNMREGEEYGHHSTTPLIDVNLYDNQGMTALQGAAANGLTDTCKVLLEQHADPNIGKQNTGYTALHFACEGGHFQTVKLLLDHKGDINRVARMSATGGKECGDGSTPLHCACTSNRLDLISAMCDGIPIKGSVIRADIHKVDGIGQTALHRASEKCTDKILACLLNKGAEVDARNLLGETPLHNAVYAHNESTVEFLLNRGADPRAESSNKQTPIRSCAAEESRIKKAGLLRRNTEEERMVSSNIQVIMELLIEKGAYIKKTDKLLEHGIPEHLRRRNAENEMRALNKVPIFVRVAPLIKCPRSLLFCTADVVLSRLRIDQAAGLGELTDEEVKRAQVCLWELVCVVEVASCRDSGLNG